MLNEGENLVTEEMSKDTILSLFDELAGRGKKLNLQVSRIFDSEPVDIKDKVTQYLKKKVKDLKENSYVKLRGKNDGLYWVVTKNKRCIERKSTPYKLFCQKMLFISPDRPMGVDNILNTLKDRTLHGSCVMCKEDLLSRMQTLKNIPQD